MKFLLDTCTFLWIISDDSELSKNAKGFFVDPENETFLSTVSGWEIAIKYSLGRLPRAIASKFLKKQSVT